ncbi:MAG: MFS transporter [Chloroflexi bacterium]|nr:MFS transporter [Chloroflexota bacterium]
MPINSELTGTCGFGFTSSTLIVWSCALQLLAEWPIVLDQFVYLPSVSNGQCRLSIQLGVSNVERGLSLSYGGDADTEAVTAGSPPGAAQRGTAFGHYTAAASLGAVIGPLLGGWIYDTYTAVWAFRANALMLGLGAVLILLVVRPGGEPDTDGNG